MSILPNNYINIFSEFKGRIKVAQYKSLRAVNSEMILTYLDIGKVISEQTKNGWGTSVIDRLSKDLQAEFIGMKGFSNRNLHRMKLVYEEMSKNSISPQAVAKIPWGHIGLIFSKLKEKNQQEFYIEKSNKEAWSRSVLTEKIKFNDYENSISFQNNFESTVDKNEIVEYRLQFSDEYDLSFLELQDRHTERQLENAIVTNITKTLGQFGNGFAFMGQ